MPPVRRKHIYVLIIPQFQDIFDSYFAGEVTKGVSLAASRLNVDILMHIVDRADHSGWLDPTLLDRRHVDGILFADIDRDVAVVKKAIGKGMPTLVLNNKLDEPINYISIDNYRSAYDVVEHLIELGHTKIATIAGDLHTQAGQARLDGYQAALAKHKIEIRPHYVKNGEFLRTPARAAAEQLFKLKERPTAIFAASDVMALEVMDVAKHRKISIPHDLSLVGFDNNPINLTAPVRLMTVAQPLVEMGRLGLERLYQIRHAKARLPLKEVIKPKIVDGSSVGSIRHK
ncbi:MAG: substrate-binding domain-containing protein [Candidatus Omnitrophica bacterium]|nr:substrate-binding domain-containing protein [Candidatus Omnitrophota bacterium]